MRKRGKKINTKKFSLKRAQKNYVKLRKSAKNKDECGRKFRSRRKRGEKEGK